MGAKTPSSGPVRLRVVTNYCETDEQRCGHLTFAGGMVPACGKDGGRTIFGSDSATNGRLPAPGWCPLRGETAYERG